MRKNAQHHGNAFFRKTATAFLVTAIGLAIFSIVASGAAAVATLAYQALHNKFIAFAAAYMVVIPLVFGIGSTILDAIRDHNRRH